MKHLGTKRLETERLVLRRFTAEDGNAMFANWASDPEVTKFLTWPAHGSADISAMILADWISHYEEVDFYQWAIVLKDFGQPIGSISVVNKAEEVGAVEIGYCIGKQWWHRGITTEALQRVIDFFFREVGANRVEAKHDVNNPNSGAVMGKCGMRREGILRQAGKNNQGVCDLCIYGILAEDRA